MLNSTEFAERILLSDTLNAKLAPPGSEGLDFQVSAPESIPDAPGRPVDLRFGRPGRAVLPSRPDLVNDERRGELLHFFANHELLATELMALALVKFPDAPEAFRRGLLKTLLEEQRHTKWYLARMEKCGIAFGDLPVSRYFWDAVAPMETPLDYVTRLSLTFEQANLDYSRHFARVMREAGDTKTAAILEQIYKDEIAHVGYGLKWFRKWKGQGESDWEAFNHALAFPLSPSRAKGNGAEFNAEGRKKAGLTDEFIAQLRLFERSKGRSPDVFSFNPNTEAEIAKGGPVEAGVAFEDLEHDLEILMAFVAKHEDIALLRELPSQNHLADLKGCGFVLPELVPLDAGGRLPPDSLLHERRLHRLRPWGPSPASEALLRPLVSQLPDCERDKVLWREDWRRLTSKPPVVGAEQDVSVCRTLEEVERTLAAGGEFVAKAPLGAAGRQNIRISDPAGAMPWIRKTIETQGAVILEPRLERVFDFSAHYEMEDDGLRHLGFVRMDNDSRGQFRAAEAGPKFLRTVAPEVARFLMERPAAGEHPQLGFYTDILPDLLEARLADACYRGPVGIDAFVHRNKDKSLALRRVVEINARFTMGRVALELSRKIDTARTARLEIRKKNVIDLSSMEKPAVSESPLRLSGGSICLNDPAQARRWLAILRVR